MMFYVIHVELADPGEKKDKTYFFGSHFGRHFDFLRHEYELLNENTLLIEYDSFHSKLVNWYKNM